MNDRSEQIHLEKLLYEGSQCNAIGDIFDDLNNECEVHRTNSYDKNLLQP